MTVFQCTDYKQFLKLKLKENSSVWGYQKRLADHAECQPSFLNRVVHGEVHLSPDHLLGLCDFWRLSEDETEYCLGLLAIARSTSPQFRKRQEQKLVELKAKQTDIGRRFNRSHLPENFHEELYYSSWLWSALHVLTSIKEFQKPAAMAERLRLPQSKIEQMLGQLRKLGFVREDKGRWFMHHEHAHISRDSILSSVNHMNWRIQAAQNSQNPGDSVHFTAVYSMDRADATMIQHQLIKMIEETQKKVEKSGAEEVYNFNCDFYRLP